jgi:hypothetical protein
MTPPTGDMGDNEMAIAEPVFIIGCIRSGTTILHKMLSAYCPSAIDIDDVDFECRTFWQQRGYNIGSPKTGSYCDGADGSDLTESRRREILDYFARRTGANRHIVAKNPHLSNKVALLHRLFPRAKIVHIIREVLSVAASTKVHFLGVARGENYWQQPFVHYWPDTNHLPCWCTIPASNATVYREGLRLRIRRLKNGRPKVPPARHTDPNVFRREHPDPSRYYPGEGFRRIPESWLRINADIIGQVDALGLKPIYLPVNYTDLVGRTKDTLRRITEFCGIDRTDPDAVPDALDSSRQHKWRQDLSEDEQRAVVDVVAEREEDAKRIVDRLPGPLLPTLG